MSTELCFMTAEETENFRRCESVIEGGLRTFVEVGMALTKIRDERLYRESHGTFEGYCVSRWGFARNYANKMIAAAEVVGNLGTIVPNLPTTESQARPLASLPVPHQAQAWTRAVEAAPNGKPTAKQVEAAVAEITGKHKSPPVADDPEGEDEPELHDTPTAPEMESQEAEWEEETEEEEEDQETEADEVESPPRPGNSGFTLRTEGLPVPAESQPTREALDVMLQTIGSSISSLDAPKGRHSYGWGGFESVVKPLSRVEIRHVDGRIEHFIERLQEYRKIIKGLVKRKVT